MKRHPLTPWLFLAPNLAGFLGFTLVPVIASLILAFFSWDLFNEPLWVGWKNFHHLVGFQQRPQGVLSCWPAALLSLACIALGLWASTKYRGWQKGLLFFATITLGTTFFLSQAQPVNGRFWYFIANTFYLLLGLPFSMACSLGLAFLLNRKFRGRNLFRLIYFLPSIVSGVGIYLLWKWIFNSDYGLINQVLATVFGVSGPAWLESSQWAKEALIMMNVWATAGGANMILYLAALQNVDPELYEAAEVDGANHWNQFRHITWPMVSPTTAFILTMGLIGGFQGGFDAAFVMTRGGPAGATTTLSYFIFESGFHHFYLGRAAAASWVLFLMVFSLTLVNWKWMANKVHY